MSESVGVVVAHPDDEVLGCGGTVARWAAEGRSIHVLILADGVSSRTLRDLVHTPSQISIRENGAHKAARILGVSSVETHNLPDNQMDSLPLLQIVKLVEAFVSRFRPSILLTHHAGDVNIDHRVVHNAVLAACRPQPGHPVKRLMFFEVPSSTEWCPPGSGPAFSPNVFIETSSTLAKKLEALDAYEQELRPYPHPRSRKAIEALALWRGSMAGVESAEAFVLGRQVI